MAKIDLKNPATDFVVAVAAGLAVIYLPNLVNEDNFGSDTVLVYDSYSTPIRSNYVVEELQDNQGLWTLRKNLLVVNFENVSNKEADVTIQMRFEGNEDEAYVSYSPGYFFESQEDLTSPQRGIWRLNLSAFGPGERAQVVLLGDEELALTDLSTSKSSVMLLAGDVSLYEQTLAQKWLQRLVGFLGAIGLAISAFFALKSLRHLLRSLSTPSRPLK